MSNFRLIYYAEATEDDQGMIVPVGEDWPQMQVLHVDESNVPWRFVIWAVTEETLPNGKVVRVPEEWERVTRMQVLKDYPDVREMGII